MGTIADKLEYLNDTKTAIKGALQNRGVAVSDTDTFRSYADKIGQIGETVEKTKFGASVDTWIGDVDANGVLNRTTWKGALNFAGVKGIGYSGLYYAFYKHTGITSVDLSSLQTVGSFGLQNAFYNCIGITSVDLSSLQSVNDSGLYSAFSFCTELTSVDLSSLQSVGSYGLYNTFDSCKKLTTMSFPSLTSVQSNSFTYTFDNCTALTEIHFRADMQATIEGLTGYSSKFGATNASIIFDL